MAKMSFFKHDLGARNDLGIRGLRSRRGLAGYGGYMALVEVVYEQGSALDLSEAWRMETVAADLGVTVQELEELIDDCAVFGLFDKERWDGKRLLISHRMADDMAAVEKAEEQRIAASAKAAEKRRRKAQPSST